MNAPRRHIDDTFLTSHFTFTTTSLESCATISAANRQSSEANLVWPYAILQGSSRRLIQYNTPHVFIDW